MWRLGMLVSATAIACANDPGPRLIAGGGIGDGEIDGTLNVFVIDDDDAAIANATVRAGDTERTTDDRGLAVFSDLSGPQTIAVLAPGHRSAVWVGADGANVTIAVEPLAVPRPERATLRGSIPGWDAVTVGPGHIKAAVVMFSNTDDLGDDANRIETPGNANLCGFAGPTCDWTLVSRTGAVTVIAAIVDRDTRGTAVESDDTQTVIGWAYLPGLAVASGVDQSGLALAQIEAGNLERVSIDLGVPPAALSQTAALVGIEAGDDEVIQLPGILTTDRAQMLVPKRTVFASDATYRLTAIAETASGDRGAQSVVMRREVTAPALVAGSWLEPPTGVVATRTRVELERVAGAKVHTIEYADATGPILGIAIFDDSTAVEIPALVALPVSGALTARVNGIGATLDVHDFSLEEDEDLLWGIAGEPVSVP